MTKKTNENKWKKSGGWGRRKREGGLKNKRKQRKRGKG